MDPVTLETLRDPWAYLAVVAITLLGVGIRALITGTLRTGREAEALEKRAEVAEQRASENDEQRNAALAVLPKVAEVLEKFHIAAEQAVQSQDKGTP